MKILRVRTFLAAVLCAVALGAALLGCTSPSSTSANESQQANRTYMSQVNETMVELGEALDQFVDAVSRGDVVNMRTQADNAYRVLDKLAGIEAPDDLKDVRDCYVEGTGKLRKALDGYIELYAETAKSEEADSAEFNARIAELQALYDEGIAALQKGDQIVASTGDASASGTAAASGDASASEEASTYGDASSSAQDASSDQGASASIAAPDSSSDSASSEAVASEGESSSASASSTSA